MAKAVLLFVKRERSFFIVAKHPVGLVLKLCLLPEESPVVFGCADYDFEAEFFYIIGDEIRNEIRRIGS